MIKELSQVDGKYESGLTMKSKNITTNEIFQRRAAPTRYQTVITERVFTSRHLKMNLNFEMP